MNFITIVSVLVAVLYGAEACEDDTQYAYSCPTYKQYCETHTWSDGKAVWEHCKKTCNKCDGDNSSDGGSDGSSDNSSEDSSCVDEYGSWCGTDTNMCDGGSWGDGVSFWKKCVKFCSCCDGSCQVKEDAKIEACGGETSTGPSASYFKSDILNYHNKLRNNHQNTPSMSWDNTLQGYAQKHCNAIVAQNRGLWHSASGDRGGSGENLSMNQLASRKVCNKAGGQASQAWYDEDQFYDYATGGNKAGSAGEATGHFTQLVWTDSTKLGCAWSINSGGNVYVCCNYSPAGNYYGQYTNKVKPLKSLKARVLQKRVMKKREEPKIVLQIPELVAVPNKEVLLLEKRD